MQNQLTERKTESVYETEWLQNRISTVSIEHNFRTVRVTLRMWKWKPFPWYQRIWAHRQGWPTGAWERFTPGYQSSAHLDKIDVVLGHEGHVRAVVTVNP